MPDQDAMRVATAPLPDVPVVPVPETPKPETAEPEGNALEGKPEEPEAGESHDETEEERKKRPRRPSRRDRIIREQTEKIRTLESRLAEVEKPKPLVEPDELQYQSHAEYIKARDEYVREQTRRELIAESERTRAAEKEKASAAEMAAKARDFTVKGAAKYTDFAEVALNPDNFDPSPEVARLVLESDQAIDLAYYLGRNPAVAFRLEEMTAVQAAREIGRIEASLTAPKPQAKPSSSAPAPIKPIGPGTEKAAFNIETASYEEFKKHRLSAIKR